jgi:hypothetical protein
MARHYKKSRRTTRKGKKSQRGGDGSAFSGAAFQTPGGVFVENRVPYSHCGDPRASLAPNVAAFETTQFGGRKQRGGGCGCMAWPPTKQSGGGSGNGGFAVDVTSNEMMKSYASLVKAPCPPSQMGGAAVDELGIVSYKTGYGFDTSSPVSTDSAHYLNPIGYNRTMAGGLRKSRSAPRKGRKSRKGRKGRKSH